MTEQDLRNQQPANAPAGQASTQPAPQTQVAGSAVPQSAPAPQSAAPAQQAPSADGATEVRRAEFQALTPGQGATSGENLDLIMGVSVSVTIELGGVELPLREVVNLGPGAVVKLNRPIGEPVDILINHELVGRGEVVVVDDQFGVRVTELAKPSSGRNS